MARHGVLVAAGLALAAAAAIAAPEAGAGHPETTTLVLLGTTDVHGHLEPTREELQLDDGTKVIALRGGAGLLGGYVAQARARFKNAVKLDDKIGAMKADLAGLPEFSDPSGIYAIPPTIQGFVVYSKMVLYAASGLDPNPPPKS